MFSNKRECNKLLKLKFAEVIKQAEIRKTARLNIIELS